MNNHEGKQRIIQEFVPGKQTTMAHMIANPKEDLYTKLGVITDNRGALGIMTITPSEAAIIGADVATKAAAVPEEDRHEKINAHRKGVLRKDDALPVSDESADDIQKDPGAYGDG